MLSVSEVFSSCSYLRPWHTARYHHSRERSDALCLNTSTWNFTNEAH